MDKQLILDALEDPKVLERTFSRRNALRGGGAWGTGLALASMPVLMTTLVKRAFAQGAALPDTIVNVLNFALLLEYLEAEFYNQGLAADGLIPDTDRAVFQEIADNENAHVAFLRAVLGANATPEPEFDYTAGGMFNTFSDYATFTLIAQAFEDTGVRAYKGQAPKLYQADNALILTAALRIHSVEARHAAAVRRVRGLQGWIPGNQPGAPAVIQAVYAGEDNVVHAGIDATTVTSESREAVTEAFDEPLGLREVLAIASPFGTGRLK